MLTSCAVCNASFAVAREEELIGTSALVARLALFNVSFDVQVGRFGWWRKQTQVRTSTISLTTWIRVWNLSQRMIDVNVVGTMCRIANRMHIFSSELVSSDDRFEIPIGPIEIIVEHSQRENMRNFRARQNNVTMTSLKIGKCDVIQMSVSPVESIGEVVNRQCIWPCNVLFPC